MYPESDESEIIVSHQPNLTHTNPIFQSSETMPLVSSEMNHPDFIRSTANQIVEDNVEMRDRAIDTHVLGKLNNGAQEGSANMVLVADSGRYMGNVNVKIWLLAGRSHGGLVEYVCPIAR
ncbi:hypothetical protein C5167_034120 [Papaver somniferum]|uniref:Uncharacterized protein n=1 Tax=Papaver somniferum TaxID=3469 RepID=A0A4Y7KFX8_PAPSO|nr:hypothetical protein C5167_034120 [Papaver somniferum]